MRKRLGVSLAAILVLALSSLPSQAGYLTFSNGWAAPSTVPMSQKTASNVVSNCKDVKTYKNLAGNSGATVVAGPHPTPTDAKIHLTVRLYKAGAHTKSCHVYTGKNNSYASCSCVYND